MAPAVQAGGIQGYAYTRSFVLDEQGHRIWAEYNPTTGDLVNEIGPAAGDLDPAEWRVMSGAEYRSYVAQYQALRAEYPDLGAPLSRQQYQTQPLYMADGTEIGAKPELASGTAFVSLLPQARRFIAGGLVLAEYPVDPGQPNSVTDKTLSMLVKYGTAADAGTVRYPTPNRIGFKTAFIRDINGEILSVPESAFEDGFKRKPGQSVLGPVPGVKVEGMYFAQIATDAEGHYDLDWFSIPCPMAFYSIDGHATATFSYRRFNPKSASRGIYFVMRPIVESCVPQTFYVPLVGPIPIGLGEITTYPPALDFPVDVMVLSGTAQFQNVQVGEQTQYTASDPDHASRGQGYYDFDDDGTDDTVVLGHWETNAQTGEKTFVAGIEDIEPDKQLQGVYFSSSNKALGTDPPDITRVLDRASFANTAAEGLLSRISVEDLRNTDLYVVRLADGKLIAERLGLNEYETGDSGADADNGRFFYSLQMRNSFGDFLRFTQGRYRALGTDFTKWQTESGINPELHVREADHLQPGDLVTLYAINRATGYIGSQTTEMQPAGTSGGAGDLSFHIDPIVLRPPNLKIWAERGYGIQAGLERGEFRADQIIGFEGAGLTSDKYIKIHTEWLDHKGRALPEALNGAGYTGRIAILSADQTLAGSAQGVYQFAIEPGKHLQVLQLPNNLVTDAQHYYIHVSGEPNSGNPIFTGTSNKRIGKADFTSTGANPGILQHRPDVYVPFKVPVFDEFTTEIQQQFYRRAKAGNPELEKPEPVYRWVYRPEMQFSSYKLNVKELRIGRDSNQDGNVQTSETVDILDKETPMIPSDNIVDLLYDLDITDLAPLDYVNAGERQELVFAVGEQELKATIADDQTLRFEDLSHIELLDPEDYLTIRLYANNDMGNVLWEYAFNKNGLHVYYKIPHKETEIKLEKVGTDKLRVRTLGGIRLKYEYILPAGAYFNGTTDGITWKIGVPGRYCSDYGVDSANCTSDATGAEYKTCHTLPTDFNAAGKAIRCSMYWEPLDTADPTKTLWDINLAATKAFVQVNYTKQDNSDEQKKQLFSVETRELKPQNPPMEGSDVEMLEALLWQFGISPQNEFYGSGGTRLGSYSTTLGGYVGGKKDMAARREYSSISPGKAAGSLEKMVRRFQGRNISGEDKGKLARNRGDTSDGIVNSDTLGDLKRIWSQYYSAYKKYRSTNLISRNDGRIDSWLAGAVAIWDNGFGARAPATYSKTEHDKMLQRAGLPPGWKDRKELLRAWKLIESQYHWGKGFPITPYRMYEGAADEYGSMSFNQVLYMFRYSNKPCSVHKESDLNFYDPAENLKGFAVHTASNKTSASGEVACHGSFWEAYVHKGLAVNHGSGGPLSYRQTTTVNQAMLSQDDSYELLMKAIAGYNSNPSSPFTKNSWPMLLKSHQMTSNFTNAGGLCFSCGYAIKVMAQYGISKRSYVWQGGAGVDVNGDGAIADIPDNPATPADETVTETTVPWCFAYGEAEWFAGKVWTTVKNQASSVDALGNPQTPVGQIACP